MSAQSEDTEVGAELHGYRIEQKLGQGGTATVYQAVHRASARRVAIKVMRRERLLDADRVNRLEREAKLIGRLCHPNIVSSYGIGRLDDGRCYIVLEYLEGRSLSKRLAKGERLPPDEAIPILEAVAGALDAAHECGIVHRDVKPSNIFLLPGPPWVKLLDFGVAKDTIEPLDDTLQTKSNLVIGTPQYMSPEQCRGKAVGQRSDIYSLGVVAYQMLSGRRPFEADTFGELILLQQTASVAPVAGRVPGIAGAVDAVLRRALDKEPARRYAGATQFVAALREALARPADAPSPPAATEADTVTLAAPRAGRRRARLIALAAALGLVAAGALGVALWPRSRPAGVESTPPAGIPAPVLGSAAAGLSVAPRAPDAGLGPASQPAPASAAARVGGSATQESLRRPARGPRAKAPPKAPGEPRRPRPGREVVPDMPVRF